MENDGVFVTQPFRDEFGKCLYCEHSPGHNIFAVITQTGKLEFDFELVYQDNLGDVIDYDYGECYVIRLNIDYNTKPITFYTVFDDAEDGMPNDWYPYHGMLTASSCQKTIEERGGTIMIWVGGSGYDHDEYLEENGDISNLTPRKTIK